MITKKQVYKLLKLLIYKTGQNFELRTIVDRKNNRTYYGIYYYSTSNCWFNLSDEYVTLNKIYHVLKTMNEYFYVLGNGAIKPMNDEQKQFIREHLQDDQIVNVRAPT